MKYDRYSKSSFDSLRDENDRCKRLAELDRDIAAELKGVIASKMQDIVDNLNRHGHSLKRNISIEDVDETDFCEGHHDRSCGFRVGSTVTISSGYNGASDSEYQEKEQDT